MAARSLQLPPIDLTHNDRSSAQPMRVECCIDRANSVEMRMIRAEIDGKRRRTVENHGNENDSRVFDRFCLCLGGRSIVRV